MYRLERENKFSRFLNIFEIIESKNRRDDFFFKFHSAVVLVKIIFFSMIFEKKNSFEIYYIFFSFYVFFYFQINKLDRFLCFISGKSILFIKFQDLRFGKNYAGEFHKLIFTSRFLLNSDLDSIYLFYIIIISGYFLFYSSMIRDLKSSSIDRSIMTHKYTKII